MITYLRCFTLAALLATPVLAAVGRIERVVEKSFTFSTPGTLKVETHGGEVRVTPSSDSTAKVTAKQKIKADSDAEANELLQKLELVIEQQGNDLVLRAKYEKQPSGFRWGSWPPVQVDFVVSVPAGFASELSTSGGSITLGDMKGKVSARTSGGNIKLGNIAAPVNAKTSGGNITLDSAGGDVDLDTSGGDVTVGKVAGRAELSTSGGNIRIEAVEGALRANTSGGGIRASIAGALKEDCSLSTSGGSVRVTLDKSAAFRLDASTSGGSVDADGLTITLDKGGAGRSKLAGTVNGGGPLLKLRTSGGSIAVAAK